MYCYQKQTLVLIEKCPKMVADVGTDPMDGDLMRPLCEEAVVGSVLAANSHGQHQLVQHPTNVTIRRFVSDRHFDCK